MTDLRVSAGTDAKALAGKYTSTKHHFPLIISVLNNRQSGVIYSDDRSDNYFIVHQFGFADLLENQRDEEFDRSLYIFLKQKKFEQNKLRWYKVPEQWVSLLRSCEDEKIVFVERTELIRYGENSIYHPSDTGVEFKEVTSDNFDAVNLALGLNLESRFWASKHDFLLNSFGVAAFISGVPAAICYACAIENEMAEVDIFTKSEYRSRGIGKSVAAEFINKCIEKNIQPHWDCYSNNQASMNLALTLGFEVSSTYQHAIISK